MRSVWEEWNLGLLKVLLEDTAIILAVGALVSTLLCSRTVPCWWGRSYKED